MNNYTTIFPTCGTTESNDSIEIKKNFLAKNASTIKVITYIVGIIVAIMIGSSLGNKAYNKAFINGYKQGYNNAKTELIKSYKTIDISKTFNYEYKK